MKVGGQVTNPSDIEAEAARRLRSKYGASLNVEQQIAGDLGFFMSKF